MASVSMATVPWSSIDDLRAQVAAHPHRDPRVIVDELRRARIGLGHGPAEVELWPKIDTALARNDNQALYEALDQLAGLLGLHHREAASLAIEAMNAAEYALQAASS